MLHDQNDEVGSMQCRKVTNLGQMLPSLLPPEQRICGRLEHSRYGAPTQQPEASIDLPVYMAASDFARHGRLEIAVVACDDPPKSSLQDWSSQCRDYASTHSSWLISKRREKLEHSSYLIRVITYVYQFQLVSTPNSCADVSYRHMSI